MVHEDKVGGKIGQDGGNSSTHLKNRKLNAYKGCTDIDLDFRFIRASPPQQACQGNRSPQVKFGTPAQTIQLGQALGPTSPGKPMGKSCPGCCLRAADVSVTSALTTSPHSPTVISHVASPGAFDQKILSNPTAVQFLA
ncbi:Protein phosphatase 2C family protein [Prunus dulcis]|uniref:Protein phosphatase 2C family protein n=1 Tax=Prunus dulcis TaxID=3755 RepID=A0A4Y1QRM7_PRUDU|nr:Protein phosphatase 2C family protein [Prunus dulcis]